MHQEASQTNCLVAELMADQGLACCGNITFGKDEIEYCQHGIHAIRQKRGWRYAKSTTGASSFEMSFLAECNAPLFYPHPAIRSKYPRGRLFIEGKLLCSKYFLPTTIGSLKEKGLCPSLK